jgi:hypothetical protein
VTITDRGQETASSTLRLSIAPSRVLGLPPTLGLTVIFGAVLGIGVVVILSVILTLRGKKSSQLRDKQGESNQGNLSLAKASFVS